MKRETLGLLAYLGDTRATAAAIFSPWMNISGSVLANFWRKRPVKEGRAKAKLR